jgi:predicted SAM-dependent methyltransferase
MIPEGFNLFPHYGTRTAAASGWKRWIHKIVPPQLAEEIRFEWNAFKVRCTQGLRRDQYEALRDILLNIGSGSSGRSGWVNLDCFPCDSVNCLWDARRSLPFKTGSVRGIFCEHFLEHLEYTREVPTFLTECLRVLLPGGTARFIVPDAERYLRAYSEGGWQTLTALRPLSANQTDRWFGHRYSTRMELINAVFRQGIEHHFAYDSETLALALQRCGFAQINLCSYGQSAHQTLLLDHPERASESLYLEATKSFDSLPQQ